MNSKQPRAEQGLHDFAIESRTRARLCSGSGGGESIQGGGSEPPRATRACEGTARFS